MFRRTDRARAGLLSLVPRFPVACLLTSLLTAGSGASAEFHATCRFPESLPFVREPVVIEVTVLDGTSPAANVPVRVAIEVLDGALEPGQLETLMRMTFIDGRAFLTFPDGVVGRGTVRFMVSVGDVPVCESEPYEIASGPRLVLHVQQRSFGSCRDWPVDTPCSGYSTAGVTATPYNVYLVAAHVDPETGIGGASLGIVYDPTIRVLDWQPCTNGLSFPTGPNAEWPASESGIRITWICPNGSVTTLGGEGLHAPMAVFSVYAYDSGTMELTANHDFDSPELVVFSCGTPSWELDESELGGLAFSAAATEPGFNPCRPSGEIIPPPPPPQPPTPPLPPAPPAGMDVVLHIAPASPGGELCTSIPNSQDQVVTSAEASPDGLDYVVYLLGTEGMGGIQAGIIFDEDTPEARGLDVRSWHACSDLEFPQDEWPASGTGNTMTWADCVETSFTAAGYLEVTAYAPSTLAITGYPVTGRIKVATCHAVEYALDSARDIARFAWVSMGGAAYGTDVGGCNPLVEACRGAGPSPVRLTTWGKLKMLYGK